MTTTDSTAPFINLFDPDFDYTSQAVADAREQSWYAQVPHGIMVLRHEEAWDILRDRRFVPGGARYMHSHGITSGPLYDWFSNMIASVSNEDHDRLRPLVIRVFSPKLVESLRPFVRQTAERLADEIESSQDPIEFVSAFAEPLPALVMCKMLGVPEADYGHFHDWAQGMGLTFNLSDEHLPEAEAAVIGLSAYVTSMLGDRRTSLTDDLVSNLIRANQAGEITDPELHNLVLTLVWAAQDTTARQLGRALVAFSQHPDQWDILANQPDLAEQAAEEICRWTPQARATFRFATEDADVHGLHIPEGTMVVICIVTANRDPRAYANPDNLDIQAARGPRQLVFGGGVHMCLGAAAARLELSEGTSALARRLGRPEIAGPITWSPSTAMIHGPHSLPMRFAQRA
jgi:cytochrome P450